MRGRGESIRRLAEPIAQLIPVRATTSLAVDAESRELCAGIEAQLFRRSSRLWTRLVFSRVSKPLKTQIMTVFEGGELYYRKNEGLARS